MSTSRNPNIQFNTETGQWEFKPAYGIIATKPQPLPQQWNPPVSQLESRLRQIERNQQILLQVFGAVVQVTNELASRPGLTAADVSKLLEFSDEDKATLDSLLSGNIINRINALEA